MAGHLRTIQSQFGAGAVGPLILEHLFRFQLIGLPDVAIAKRLDVLPDLVKRRRVNQMTHQRSQLVLDPQAMLTRELPPWSSGRSSPGRRCSTPRPAARHGPRRN